jgi:hypothetical protein
MDRRQLITQATMVSSTLAFSSQLLARGEAKDSPGSLLDQISQCQLEAYRCQAHCLSLLEKKDTGIVACLLTVNDLIDLNQAALGIFSRNSATAKDFALVLRKASDLCGEECKKHAKHHETCAACEKACIALSKAIAAAYA